MLNLTYANDDPDNVAVAVAVAFAVAGVGPTLVLVAVLYRSSAALLTGSTRHELRPP